MIHPIITNRLEDIRHLLKKHKVTKGYIFGSATSSQFDQNSDIDVLVEVDETLDPAILGQHLWDLQFELEEMLSRNVDLLTSRSLRNTYFINSVNATKELIYAG